MVGTLPFFNGVATKFIQFQWCSNELIFPDSQYNCLFLLEMCFYVEASLFLEFFHSILAPVEVT
jgi:hypothetical protein